MPIYDCPSYPDKEQTVDYCINAWDAKENKELRRATKLDEFTRPGQTIYLADWASTPAAGRFLHCGLRPPVEMTITGIPL